MLIVVEAENPTQAVEKYLRQDTVVDITFRDQVEDVRVSTIETLPDVEIVLP
jgi:hypothetical protein